MLSYYILRVIEKEMIGIAVTNAPAVMAPLGGRKPFLGTNPISVGIPFKEPILFDGAMSVTSRGKIMIAMQKGEKIPENWALDEEGKPTTDPSRAIKGALLPDGVKGYAFALFIDLICGALIGGKYGHELPPNFASQGGFSILVINPRFFRNYSDYLSSVEDYITKLKSGETNVKLPGEIEFSRLKKASKVVHIDPKIASQLNDLAKELGCSVKL
jgi:L-2-hydroxycarboxylate dehydrogenase (NAD+)